MKKIAKVQKTNGIGAAVVVTGTIVGAALGAAAALLLAPESGKRFRKDVKKRSADFYRYMAPKVKKVRSMGENEFKAFVGRTAKEYAVAKKLTSAEQKALLGEAKKSWGHIKKHLAKKKKAGR